MARRPTTPRTVKWLGGDLPKDSFAACATRYSAAATGIAATYQSIPRLIDEQLAAHGARVCMRAVRATRSDLDGDFESWFGRRRRRR
jgi:cytochrome P450/NADPH-cytochrome P450 reductase